MKPCLAVDFDGTLVDHVYPGVGKVKPGAKEAMQRFRDLGYHVIIWSCRTCHWMPGHFPPNGISRDDIVRDMVEALDTNDIPYDEVDDGTRGKPMAEFYIDDKGLRFEDNWDEIADAVERITRFKQENA
jgi:hypothetical protein